MMLFGLILWERLEYHDLYTRPISTHWFETTCARAAERLKIDRPWTSDVALAVMQDGTGRFRLGPPPYKVTYECWPDTVDPRGPKGGAR